MGEPTIPLWKQELLKRKQGKLTHEKLISAQNPEEPNSKHRSGFANTASSALNHRSNNTEKKPSIQQYVYSKNHGDLTKKGTLHSHNIVLDESIDSFDTRQTSRNLKTQISSADSGASRLDSFEDSRPVNPNRDIGRHNNNFDFARSSSGTHGISQHSRGHTKQEESNIVIKLDESKSDRLTMNERVTGQDCGVDSEHIRPQDVKKMWQKQVTKDELLPKACITHSKSPVTHTKKEPPTGLPISHHDFPDQNSIQVSSEPTSAPKAYKSPYAKTEWCRQTSASHETSVKSSSVLKVQRNNIMPPAVKSSLSNGTVARNGHDEKVEDEHIQSVKSLLGLFGGKAKAGISRKISDNAIMDNKTEKLPHGVDYRTSEIKPSGSKRPGLFKHHSEPNLFSPAGNEFVIDVPRSPKKLPIHEAATEEVAHPSHHISQGIQERMTRLRRASHSNMEDMDGFMDYQNRLNSDTGVGDVKDNYESKQTIPNESTRQNETVHKGSFSKKFENDKYAGVKTEVGNCRDLFNNVSSTTVQNDQEKPPLPGNVNNNDKIKSPAVKTPSIVENHQNNDMNNAQNNFKSSNQHSSPEQPFSNRLSVFGSTVAKKATTQPMMSDTKDYKSKNKHHSKQNNYVVENNQSESGLHNDAVSTECSTGIKLNQQEVKPVIKTEKSTEEVEKKTEKKPRRKGLNVVDPLAVLQLTKDPILLREKPVATELGLFKVSESGRKPKVEIIKHEPDKKAKIAQINRAWDLYNLQPSLKQNNVAHKTMPASSIQGSPTTPHNIPVTSIDEIPVSVIDDVANKSDTDVQTKSNINSDKVNVGNATVYSGILSPENAKLETESAESDDEFIPVSSIDAEVDLGPPPEIVFDKMPEKLKSCFARNGQKLGNVSFFEHVFIHDYQSETAAAADWDFENGTAFSSYMPAAVKQYEGLSKSSNTQPPPTTPVDTPTTPPEEIRYDEPLITYNEDESVDFTGSSDSTAGALLF